MILRRFLPLVIIALALLMAAVQTGWPDGYSIPLRHPDEEKDLRTCTDCHDRSDTSFAYQRFNHTPGFGEKHHRLARTGQSVCEMCHRPSDCTACHGVGVELKPSLRHHGDTRGYRPHRGDYLTRHRIDGRIDPTKCFRCHGAPKTARTCVRCHH
jgi:hypothetical protein